MLVEQKNVIESIAAEFITQSLTLRFDICACELCKKEILSIVLSKISAKYCPEEENLLQKCIEETKKEQGESISRSVLNAIETVSKNPPHKLEEDLKLSLQQLLDKIFIDRGLDFSRYRREILKRRIALRIRANKLSSYSKYIDFLLKNPEEYDKLFNILCINVSEFFRDPEVWIAIKYLLENLLRKKIQNKDTSFRIWSAGCANGEEPFSIAILLKEIAPNIPWSYPIEIIATDIDKGCLKAASTAEYTKERLRNVDEKTLTKYFIAAQNGYRLKEEIKNKVTFLYQDLISKEPVEQNDIILCRNVFIHFERSLQSQLLDKFRKSLKKNGYLIMGKVEAILEQAKETFQKIDFNSIIYQKK